MDTALLNHPVPTLLLDEHLTVHAASKRAQRLLGLAVIGQRFANVWTEGGAAAERKCRRLHERGSADDDEDENRQDGQDGSPSADGAGDGAGYRRTSLKRRRRALSAHGPRLWPGGAGDAGRGNKAEPSSTDDRRPSLPELGDLPDEDDADGLKVTFVPFDLRYILTTTNPLAPPNLPFRRFRLSIDAFTPSSMTNLIPGGPSGPVTPSTALALQTQSIRLSLGMPDDENPASFKPPSPRWYIIAMLPPDPEEQWLGPASPQPAGYPALTKGVVVKAAPRRTPLASPGAAGSSSATPPLYSPLPLRPTVVRQATSYHLRHPPPTVPAMISPPSIVASSHTSHFGPPPISSAQSYAASSGGPRAPPSITTSSEEDRHPLLGVLRRAMLDAVDLPMHAMSIDESLSVFNASGASLFQVTVPERVATPEPDDDRPFFGTEQDEPPQPPPITGAQFGSASRKPVLAAWRLFDANFQTELPLDLFPMRRAIRGETIVGQHYGCEMPDGQRRTMSMAARPVILPRGPRFPPPARPGVRRMDSSGTTAVAWEGATGPGEEKEDEGQMRSLATALAKAGEAGPGGEGANGEGSKDDEGEIVGGVVWVRDITDLLAQRKADDEQRAQLRAEALAAEEADKLKSAFIGSLSHEIRTPIASILGITDLLVDSPLSAEQREYADTIKSAGAALLGLIGDVLDLSKIESGKLDLDAVRFDVRELVADVEKVFAFSSRGKMTTFSSEIDVPDDVRIVFGDPGRTRQILNNLLSNAIKFTPKGSVHLAVRVLPDPDPAAHAVVLRATIRDTGIGLTRDTLRKLYKPFTQADRSTARVWGGSGLGLSIVKRLVEAMGGSVELESKGLGKGCVATVVVTFQVDEEAADASGGFPDGEMEMDYPDEPEDGFGSRRVSDVTMQTSLSRPESSPSTPGASAAAAGQNKPLSPHPAHPVLLPTWSLAALNNSSSTLAHTERSRSVSSSVSVGPAMSTRSTSPGGGTHPATLSASLASPLLSSSAAHPPPRLLRPRSEYTILVAEDNPVMAKITCAILNKRGFTNVDLVGDGKQAVEAVQRKWDASGGRSTYDLGLIDVMMPVMDGHAATRAIRGVMVGQWMPIVALTASAVRGDREKCFAASMDDYLTKPLRPELLEQRVLHHMLSLSKVDAAQNPIPSRTDSPASSLLSSVSGASAFGPGSSDEKLAAAPLAPSEPSLSSMM